MKKHNLQITTWVILLLVFTGLTGCSMMSQVGKTVRNATTFGKHKTIVKVDDSLIIPPGLRNSAASSHIHSAGNIQPMIQVFCSIEQKEPLMKIIPGLSMVKICCC